MSRIDPYENFSQKDKIKYFWCGDAFIKNDVSEIEYEEFKKRKNEWAPYLKYTSLHGWYMSSLTPKGGFYKYYIPEDIFEYVFYKDGEIIEKKEVPDEVKEKFLICKRVMDVDFLYFRESIFINGKKIGLQSSWKIGNSIIFIKKSRLNRISWDLDCKSVLDIDYIKNFSKYKAEKEYFLQHGYRE